MNLEFWKQIQQCWRITLSIEEKELSKKEASKVAINWGTAIISNPYKNNPLDDLSDDDEEY